MISQEERVLTAAAAREVDQAAGLAGISVDLLLENAGRGLAELLWQRSLLPGRPVAVLCGKGHNGADGLVLARQLADRGIRVVVGLAALRSSLGPDTRRELKRLAPYPVDVYSVARPGSSSDGWEEMRQSLGGIKPVLVDAVLGTGAKGALAAPLSSLLAKARRDAAVFVSVDLPTGVSPDGGDVAEGAVPADVTAAMDAWKVGHLVGPGAAMCGEVVRIPIGLAVFRASGPPLWRTGERQAKDLAPIRPAWTHKGSAGHVLVVAGSDGMAGAAVLAARGALRSGSGLVTLATPSEIRPEVVSAIPECLTISLPERGQDGQTETAAAWRSKALVRKTALAIGPGLGASSDVGRLVADFLQEAAIPIVLDADALNAWAALYGPGHALSELKRRRRPAGVLLLTPHPGELGRLTGRSAHAIDADRIRAAREAADASGAVVLLKGHPTVVADPSGVAALNSTGGPILAVGGSGDVLTGLLAGLLAQGMESMAAARLGAYIHGRAGDEIEKRRGVDRGITAMDVVDALPAAWSSVVRGKGTVLP